MKPNDYKKDLDIYKTYVGLSDWSIEVTDKYIKLEELANVEWDTYEQVLKVTLSKKFEKLPWLKRQNTLIHEMVHARIGIYNERKNVLVERLEEELVNDIVRGFERK